MSVPVSAGRPPPRTVNEWKRATPWRWTLRALSVVALVLGVWLIVIPQWRQAAVVLPRLEQLPVAPIVLALLAQAASLVCFSAMTMLLVGPPLGLGTALRIDLADLAVNHTVPGGGGVAAAVRFRLLVRRGLDPGRALAVASIEITVSNLALAAVFLVGLLLTAGAAAVVRDELWAAVLMIVAVIAVVIAGWLLARHPRVLLRGIAGAECRIPLMRRARLSTAVQAGHEQVRALEQHPGLSALCSLLALGNWLFDALSLWLVLFALGFPALPGPLFTAYGVATILAQLPLTPGGIGLVEGVLVPALVAVGATPDVALLAVLGWRALQYWLPIPVGAVSGLSLVRRRGRRGESRQTGAGAR